MRMAHLRRGMILAVAALVGQLAAPADRIAEATASDASAGCDSGSWTAGTTNLCRGDLVYRDYVYDDYGANTGTLASSTCPVQGQTSTTPTGDQRYPAGDENTADLRMVRMSVKGGRLLVTFTLNAMFDDASTVAAIAIDTDDNPTTGGGKWPSVRIRSRGWDVAAAFRAGMTGVSVDTAANTITGSLPMPSGTVWRIQAVTGRSDGTVMNVAFRGTDERGPWFEDHQAAALADSDISGFGHRVPVSDLKSGVTRTATVGPGLHQRVYRSAYTLGRGEGMTYEGIPGTHAAPVGQVFNFVGPYQPFAIYLPDKPGPHGVQLVLHGYCDPMNFMLAKPGAQQELGEARNRILITPLGRGPAGWYAGPSERDVLDALDDTEAAYPVDTDREIISGYSMGGFGTLRLAALYPDRFAGFIDWVGYTDCLNATPYAGECPIAGADANPVDYVGNLRWVPGEMLYSGADQLVHATSAVALQQAFAATGYPYQWWFHPAAEHGTYLTLDDWRKESRYSATLTRAVNPPRVTYRYNPELDNAEYDLAHDRAYWLSGLTTAGDGHGDVDLTTHGCGGSLPVTSATNGAGTDPLPWVSEGAEVAGSTPIIRAPRLTGSLSNIATVTVDVSAACLRRMAVEYDLTTDGPARIRFNDGRSIELPGPGRHTGTLRT